MTLAIDAWTLAPSSPTTDASNLIVAAAFGVPLLFLGIVLLMRVLRQRAVRRWPRAPAVVLASDRVKHEGPVRPDRVSGTTYDLVLEVSPTGQDAYRVKLQVCVEREIHEYVGKDSRLFVYIDPNSPENVDVDYPELWARRETEREQERAERTKRDATREQKQAEERDRLLKG